MMVNEIKYKGCVIRIVRGVGTVYRSIKVTMPDGDIFVAASLDAAKRAIRRKINPPVA